MEGLPDVGKDVVKVKRGFVVTGKVTVYNPSPIKTSDAHPTSASPTDPAGHTECITDSSSSSSSSSSSAVNIVSNGGSGSAHDMTDKQEGEQDHSALESVEDANAILDAAMYASVLDILDPQNVVEIPDNVQNPLVPEIQDPIPGIIMSEADHLIIAPERQGDVKQIVTIEVDSNGAPIFDAALLSNIQVIESTASTAECAAQAECAIPGVWYVLYEDGSEATLDYSDLRCAFVATLSLCHSLQHDMSLHDIHHGSS